MRETIFTRKGLKKENQNKILRVLSEGPKNYKKLLADTKLSPPTLSKHLKDLEEERRIAGKRSTEDRRMRIYEITGLPPGRVGRFINVFNSQLENPLDQKQQKRLCRLLSQKVLDLSDEIVKKCYEIYHVESERDLSPLYASIYYTTERVAVKKTSALAPEAAEKMAKKCIAWRIAYKHRLTEVFDKLALFFEEIVSINPHWAVMSHKLHDEYMVVVLLGIPRISFRGRNRQ